MFSKLFFVILYLFDIIIAYAITNDYIVSAVTAVVIPLILFVWQKLTLFRSGAMPITKCRTYDAKLLRSAYREVEMRAKSCGYKIWRSAKLYISNEDTHNAYNCGRAIVVNRPLLYGPELNAVIAHELNHFRMILAKLLIPVKRGLCNLIVTLLLAVEMAVSRSTEYASDAFATDTGYGEELIDFLSMDMLLRKPLTFTERLLSSHPSDQRRCARIERRIAKIYMNEKDRSEKRFYIE